MTSSQMYLESEPRLDLVGQNIRNDLVEVLEDFHGELRLDAAEVNQFIEGVDEGCTDAGEWVLLVWQALPGMTVGGDPRRPTVELVGLLVHLCGDCLYDDGDKE